MSSSTATAGHAAGTSNPDHLLLTRLRAHRRAPRRLGGLPHHPPSSPPPPTWGQRVADRVAAVVGSWAFILLNLVLSFQAAYTAPAIMMSQNRQAAIDRLQASNDYEVNVKAELEIEALHEKIDLLREQEIRDLSAAVKSLSEQLGKLSRA